MTFKFGPLQIDPVELGSRGNAVLGIRDSGKTVTAKVLAEHLHDAGIPLVVFDPSGMWRFLRVPGKGKGRPVVVAGGKDGDLPLTPASAPKIVEAAMQAGLSLVLNLDLNLSKADWRAIVRDSVRMLMQRNADFGLRHVILEEAAEFVPQVVRGDHAVVYGEVERMMRIGGNAGLGCTLVNQRAEEVNKAVLELCDNLFLHRQKGRNSLTALTKWLDIGAVKKGSDIIDTLSTLPSGECWAWLHGSDRPVHVRVSMCDSFHPNRRDLRAGGTAAKLKPVPMEDFVEKLKTQLPEIEEQRKANDAGELRKEIVRLKRELDHASKPVPMIGVDPAQLKAEYEKGYADGAKDTRDGMSGRNNDARSRLKHLAGELDALARAIEEPVSMPKKFQRVDIPHTASATRPTAATRSIHNPPAPSPPRRPGEGMNGHGSPDVGTGGLRRILVALAQCSDGLTNRQIGVRACLSSKSGTFSTYLSKARSNGWVEDRGDLRRITDVGVAALGSYDPLPVGQDLLDHWLRELGDSGASRLLRAAAEAYPNSLTNAEAGERANLSHVSGTFSTYLSKLRTLELVTGRGDIRASDDLFA